MFHISGNQYPPFPAMHHTRRIWDELLKGFDEYHVIARGEGNRYIHSVARSMHLHLLPAFGERMWPFFFLGWILPWFVLRYKPTHLLVQCPILGGLAAAFCSKVFRIPLLVELHGAHYFAPARPGWKGVIEHVIYRKLSSITFSAATRIRSLSQDMSEYILQIYGESAAKKVMVIPNRVDLNVFRCYKDSYSTDKLLRIITVGSFSETKNHCQLIKDLDRTGVSFHLTIVGAGSLKEKYIAIANQLCIRDRLEIIENLDHQSLAPLLPKHDVYIHYALSEGVPRAILEAMAVGLPVVATHVGFIKGVLVNGENAIVIDKPYADGLTQAIRLLAESECLRKRLGVAARHTIKDRFEWNRVFELYRSAIKSMD
ncbi:MAG: glycosyltransferase family 4 protein [bacterium]|uniref:Glycosyltransferase family 4 protein n=1 Tax=Candidatus Methylomirabilis tolerans TaxID=3123416 RepID=A0AAJ1AH65_9BACT|nr:glycosyltransferase family 4 protein [Candidatus Methylomirabilis sp.]